jgi:hypothetical protein
MTGPSRFLPRLKDDDRFLRDNCTEDGVFSGNKPMKTHFWVKTAFGLFTEKRQNSAQGCLSKAHEAPISPLTACALRLAV